MTPERAPTAATQGTNSSEETLAPKQPPPVTTFGSFLNRNTPTKEAPAPTKKAENETSSPLRSFRKPGKSPAAAKQKVSLEDQSSQDFVPITNSGKKKRVLTEHQKDKMTTRPQIPALYSEVSREDSMAMLIPQEFDSQSSTSFQVC